jgi:hypothetical protein
MDEHTIFIAAMILGAPLVLMAGKQIRRMAIMLAFLALLFSHPVLGFLSGAAIILHRPVRWFLEGLFIGEGLRLSGLFRRLSIPHRGRQRTPRIQRFRRPPRGYRPNDDYPDPQEAGGRTTIDPWPDENFPENLGR